MSNERFRHVPVVDKSGKLINVMSHEICILHVQPIIRLRKYKENYFKANQVVLIIISLHIYTLVTTILAAKLV